MKGSNCFQVGFSVDSTVIAEHEVYPRHAHNLHNCCLDSYAIMFTYK